MFLIPRKRRKQTLKIKTWVSKYVESLHGNGRKDAVLDKVRSAFPQGGHFFILREAGQESGHGFGTQGEAHHAYLTQDFWKQEVTPKPLFLDMVEKFLDKEATA